MAIEGLTVPAIRKWLESQEPTTIVGTGHEPTCCLVATYAQQALGLDEPSVWPFAGSSPLGKAEIYYGFDDDYGSRDREELDPDINWLAINFDSVFSLGEKVTAAQVLAAASDLGLDKE